MFCFNTANYSNTHPSFKTLKQPSLGAQAPPKSKYMYFVCLKNNL